MKKLTLFLLVASALGAKAQTRNFQIAAGYGTSTVGAGIAIQGNLGFVVAAQIGIGYIPGTSSVPGTAGLEGGLKFYFSRANVTSAFSPYAEIEFGTLGESANVETFYPYGFQLTNNATTLSGPSVLFGTEIYLPGDRFGFNLALGYSYNTVPDPANTKGLFAFDLGLTVGL